MALLAARTHGRYDLIMIKEPLAALPTARLRAGGWAAGCPPARPFSVGEVARSMSDIYSEALFFHSSICAAPVLYMVLPSCRSSGRTTSVWQSNKLSFSVRRRRRRAAAQCINNEITPSSLPSFLLSPFSALSLYPTISVVHFLPLPSFLL